MTVLGVVALIIGWLICGILSYGYSNAGYMLIWEEYFKRFPDKKKESITYKRIIYNPSNILNFIGGPCALLSTLIIFGFRNSCVLKYKDDYLISGNKTWEELLNERIMQELQKRSNTWPTKK